MVCHTVSDCGQDGIANRCTCASVAHRWALGNIHRVQQGNWINMSVCKCICMHKTGSANAPKCKRTMRMQNTMIHANVQSDSEFQEPVPAAAFISPEFAANFFTSEACFR